eukprot:3876866-Pyramimonas_sp.AAC.1
MSRPASGLRNPCSEKEETIGPSGKGKPIGVQLAWRRTQPYAVVSTVFVSNALGGVPYRATKRCPGCGNRM